MTKGAIDRRAARTRARLQHAHLALILEKGYEATTIADICKAARVGRSTFYAHYACKDELKRDGLTQLRALLVARQREARQAGIPLGFIGALFDHAHDHVALYRALARGRGRAVALAEIRTLLADLVRPEIAACGDTKMARPLAVEFFVGAIMAVLTWWLDGGAELPAAQVDAAVRRLATRALAYS